MDDDELISIPEIQKGTGDSSRSYVYANVLPHLEVVKVGAKTTATRASFRKFLKNLPRKTFTPKSPEAA